MEVLLVADSVVRSRTTLGALRRLDHVVVHPALERASRLLGTEGSLPGRALEAQLALRLHRLVGTVEE
jgi:hypothetical protein